MFSTYTHTAVMHQAVLYLLRHLHPDHATSSHDIYSFFYLNPELLLFRMQYCSIISVLLYVLFMISPVPSTTKLMFVCLIGLIFSKGNLWMCSWSCCCFQSSSWWSVICIGRSYIMVSLLLDLASLFVHMHTHIY